MSINKLNTMSPEAAEVFAELMACVAFGVKLAGVVPVSELYEAFERHNVPKEDFSDALAILIEMGWVAESGMVLTWTKD